MINHSHQKAFSLLLLSKERPLNGAEQSFLDEHLETCTECRSHARLHARLQKDLKPQEGDLVSTGQPRPTASSGIVSTIERKAKRRKVINTAWRLARAGIAIVLLGTFLWILIDILPTLTPGSFSGSEIQATISSQIAPTSTPVLEPSPTSPVSETLSILFDQPSSTRRTEVITYIVQEGDTVIGIAEEFNLKPETILWGNLEVLAEDFQVLTPGLELSILPVDGVYHEWAAGESLIEVAGRYGVAPQDIVNWPGNHLKQETLGDYSDPNIESGTYLVIPDGELEFKDFSLPLPARRFYPNLHSR